MIFFDTRYITTCGNIEQTPKHQTPNMSTETASIKRKNTDDNGSVKKKVRQTNKVRYPEVKIQPRTAYMLFSTEMASKARDSTPDGEKLGTKGISELWNKTSNEDRKKWIDMAAADKERYFEEVKSHGYDIKKKNKKPTRPCSAFLLYARGNQREYRDTHGLTYPEALKALGARWKDPSLEHERAPYIEESKRMKEEWEKQQQEQK